jgi:hypothetical protein
LRPLSDARGSGPSRDRQGASLTIPTRTIQASVRVELWIEYCIEAKTFVLWRRIPSDRAGHGLSHILILADAEAIGPADERQAQQFRIALDAFKELAGEFGAKRCFPVLRSTARRKDPVC